MQFSEEALDFDLRDRYRQNLQFLQNELGPDFSLDMARLVVTVPSGDCRLLSQLILHVDREYRRAVAIHEEYAKAEAPERARPDKKARAVRPISTDALELSAEEAATGSVELLMVLGGVAPVAYEALTVLATLCTLLGTDVPSVFPWPSKDSDAQLANEVRMVRRAAGSSGYAAIVVEDAKGGRKEIVVDRRPNKRGMAN
jgi:hypothetical protein